MTKRNILIICTLLWFTLSWWIFYYLLENDFLSTDLTNTYVVFPNWWQYNAPTWYMEYYLSKEWGWMNKYTSWNMTSFPQWIDTWNNN